MASAAFVSPAVLTPAQEQVIALIAAGLPIRKVADEAGIHRNTIGNWRRTIPLFAEALADAQYERVLYWRDAAEEHAALAIDTIADILADRKAAPSVRLRAALAILERATTLPPPEPALPAPSIDPAPGPTLVVQVAQQENVHNPAQPTPIRKPARNAPCPCGSGKKHKYCCLTKPRAPAS